MLSVDVPGKIYLYGYTDKVNFYDKDEHRLDGM